MERRKRNKKPTKINKNSTGKISKKPYMDEIIDIPTITEEFNKEFIILFKKRILVLKSKYIQENFADTLTQTIENLREVILMMPWPIRVKDEIMMYLELFRAWLLQNKRDGAEFLNASARLLLLIIKSLIPSMYLEEGNTEEDQKQLQRKTKLIKAVRTGKGDLNDVCNGLLQDFGIIEQRNIGAPQFCITEVTSWDPKERISFSGWAWAAVPVGVYRKDEIEVEQEVQIFTDNYPEMMERLQIALKDYGFTLKFCGVGFSFKAEYTAEAALEHIGNWFKICLFTAVTALSSHDEYAGFMRSKTGYIRDFIISWEEEVPMISIKPDEGYSELTTELTTKNSILQDFMKRIGWELVEKLSKTTSKRSQKESNFLKFRCTRPLWSLINGLGCWMSKKVLEEFGWNDFIDLDTNYCSYIVKLQNITGENIWDSKPRPNSLVYRPDNPNFTDREDVGQHYHIHVYKEDEGTRKKKEEFEGGKGFAVAKSSTAAPVWQGFKIFQNLK